MTVANRKFQQLKKQVHAWKASEYQRDGQLEEPINPASITTSEVVCQSCGFKARYRFIRCPECNKVYKSTAQDKDR